MGESRTSCVQFDKYPDTLGENSIVPLNDGCAALIYDKLVFIRAKCIALGVIRLYGAKVPVSNCFWIIIFLFKWSVAFDFFLNLMRVFRGQLYATAVYFIF